jgi:hypothetical protein
MKKLFAAWVVCQCVVGWTAEPDVAPLSQTPVRMASEVLQDFPSALARSEERARLGRERQSLEAQYKVDMAQCYQHFDVNTCRLKARERRIAGDALLRQDELRFNAQERKIHALEVQRNLAERSSEAEQKKVPIERADLRKPEKIDPELRVTKRTEYEQKQREAAQHRIDVEKKLRERNKELAAPLPVPSQ